MEFKVSTFVFSFVKVIHFFKYVWTFKIVSELTLFDHLIPFFIASSISNIQIPVVWGYVNLSFLLTLTS